jgi:hypothetical protein
MTQITQMNSDPGGVAAIRLGSQIRGTIETFLYDPGGVAVRHLDELVWYILF